jgi:hypothetical protein
VLPINFERPSFKDQQDQWKESTAVKKRSCIRRICIEAKHGEQ